MLELSIQGQEMVGNLARRHGFSPEAVTVALRAVMAGNGTMAQFSHPEFGGGSQWMQGGMTMVGDMFNNDLRARVAALCGELSQLLSNAALWQPAFAPAPSADGGAEVSLFIPPWATGSGWPPELGDASATGAQNNIRYAIFPSTRRLAIDINGRITLYDTLNHDITGISQQQGPGTSLSFTSQYGLVRLEELPIVSP